jgi:hypothetical protein
VMGECFIFSFQDPPTRSMHFGHWDGYLTLYPPKYFSPPRLVFKEMPLQKQLHQSAFQSA